MDFFIDPTADTDQDIQNSYYDGLESEADGIDLRIEMNRILYGSVLKRPLGHWVIARVFDGAKKSKYFNEYSKEGIMGPSHPFKDYLVRARRVASRLTRGSVDGAKPADITQSKYQYYFEWTVPLRDGDQIFEIENADHKTKPTEIILKEKFDIDRVHAYRLENGNVQYITAVGKYNNITY